MTDTYTHFTQSIGSLIGELHILKNTAATNGDKIDAVFEVPLPKLKERVVTNLRNKGPIRELTETLEIPSVSGVTYTHVRALYNLNIAPYINDLDQLAKIPHAWFSNRINGEMRVKDEYLAEALLAAGGTTFTNADLTAISPSTQQGLSPWLPLPLPANSHPRPLIGKLGKLNYDFSLTANGFITRVMVKCSIDITAVDPMFLAIPFSTYTDISAQRMINIYARHDTEEICPAAELGRLDIIKWFSPGLVAGNAVDLTIAASIRGRASDVTDYLMSNFKFDFSNALQVYMDTRNIEGCKLLFEKYYTAPTSIIVDTNAPVDYAQLRAKQHSILEESQSDFPAEQRVGIQGYIHDVANRVRSNVTGVYTT